MEIVTPHHFGAAGYLVIQVTTSKGLVVDINAVSGLDGECLENLLGKNGSFPWLVVQGGHPQVNEAVTSSSFGP